MTHMNTLGSATLSDYQGRTVTIQVTGVRQQSVLKSASYEVRVPYSQMSQVLQTINRQGGQVVSVQLMNNAPTAGAEAEAATATADTSESKVTSTDDSENNGKRAGRSGRSSKRKRR